MPKKTFRDAVDAAEYLQWKPGLQALKKGEGKGRIRANDSQRLLGSSSIDDDCVRAFPTASRWDYVIGYERSGKAVAHSSKFTVRSLAKCRRSRKASMA